MTLASDVGVTGNASAVEAKVGVAAVRVIVEGRVVGVDCDKGDAVDDVVTLSESVETAKGAVVTVTVMAGIVTVGISVDAGGAVVRGTMRPLSPKLDAAANMGATLQIALNPVPYHVS